MGYGTKEKRLQLDKFITNATAEVFATMIFMELIPGVAESDSGSGIYSNISSMIGLAGDLKGILAVHCPEHVAFAISGAMLGMEMREIDNDVMDAMGEIANMVAGGLKASLLEHERNVELAIPTTVVGNSIRTSALSGTSCLVVPFRVPDGEFFVELKYILN